MKSHSDLAVQARGLVMVFGSARAVDGVDLNVRPGAVYGLLGREGAGKTTLLRILAAQLAPSAGRALVFGHDVVRDAGRVRARTGVTGQADLVDADLTVRENLTRRTGRSAGSRARAAEFLDTFGADKADRRASECSPRVLHCLDLALVLVSGADLLLLDEPTVGLSSAARQRVWDAVRTIAAEGVTVLLATRYLDEASGLADRIAVLDHGRVVAEGSAAELRADSGSDAIRLRLRDPGDRFRAERLLFETLGVRVDAESDPAVLVAHVGDPESAALALAELSLAEVAVVAFAYGRASMGRMFLDAADDPHDLPVPDEDGPDEDGPDGSGCQ